MIKGEYTIDNKIDPNVSYNSHKRVIKICDECGVEIITTVRQIHKSRTRSNDGMDRCLLHAIRHAGKLRRVQNIVNEHGYVNNINDKNKRTLVHRTVMENHLNRKLNKNEIIHHIDGNKSNNILSNLLICNSNSDHANIHANIEHVAFELIRDKKIIFNLKTRSYEVNNSMYKLEESYGFEQIAIKQKKNICKSRLDADITSEIFRGFNVKVPLIASNMSTVINSEFYLKLVENGAFGFLHRAQQEAEYLYQVQELSKKTQHVPVSIGIGISQYELGKKLIHAGGNVVLIDIAHGYSDEVINLGRKLKKEYPHIKMIVGNTANPDMMEEVDDFADAVKVGIAQGFACETKNTAGCTEKQFSCNMKFKEVSKKLGLPFISDGGTREPADLTKAIASGANSVMAGSIFAACPESASKIIDIDGVSKKLYAGMASEYVQNEWKGGLKPGTCSEGGIRYLDIGLPVEKLIERYSGALRTGISYSGANSIKMMQEIVEFVKLG